MLSFFGRGSAFTPEHNSAYFTDGSDLILIDCAMSSFMKLIKIGPDALMMSGMPQRITILVTHTHGDHIGGIPMLIHYSYYVWHIPVTVAAPSEEVMKDMKYLLERMEGCNENGYTLTTADTLNKWVRACILTEHAEELKGRCFGYALNVDGRNIIYTGDSNTLAPFSPYLTEGSILYTEAATNLSPVHLYLEDNLGYLKSLTEKGIEVYLMHLDNEDKTKELIKDTALKLAPVINK